MSGIGQSPIGSGEERNAIGRRYGRSAIGGRGGGLGANGESGVGRNAIGNGHGRGESEEEVMDRVHSEKKKGTENRRKDEGSAKSFSYLY